MGDYLFAARIKYWYHSFVRWIKAITTGLQENVRAPDTSFSNKWNFDINCWKTEKKPGKRKKAGNHTKGVDAPRAHLARMPCGSHCTFARCCQICLKHFFPEISVPLKSHKMPNHTIKQLQEKIWIIPNRIADDASRKLPAVTCPLGNNLQG